MNKDVGLFIESICLQERRCFTMDIVFLLGDLKQLFHSLQVVFQVRSNQLQCGSLSVSCVEKGLVTLGRFSCATLLLPYSQIACSI